MGNSLFTIPDGQNMVQVNIPALKTCLDNPSMDQNTCFSNNVKDNSGNMLVHMMNNKQNFDNVDMTAESTGSSSSQNFLQDNKIILLIAVVIVLCLIFRKK